MGCTACHWIWRAGGCGVGLHARPCVSCVQDIEQGRHPAAASSRAGGAQEAAAEAVRCASALLADCGCVSAPVAMRFLPWLVSAAPQDAAAVLQVRDLPVTRRILTNGNTYTQML